MPEVMNYAASLTGAASPTSTMAAAAHFYQQQVSNSISSLLSAAVGNFIRLPVEGQLFHPLSRCWAAILSARMLFRSSRFPLLYVWH
jgi:hypothetical protein